MITITPEVATKVLQRFDEQRGLTELEKAMLEALIHLPLFQKFGAEMLTQQIKAVCIDKALFRDVSISMLTQMVVGREQTIAEALVPYIIAMCIGYRIHEEEILAEVQKPCT